MEKMKMDKRYDGNTKTFVLRQLKPNIENSTILFEAYIIGS